MENIMNTNEATVNTVIENTEVNTTNIEKEINTLTNTHGQARGVV